MSQDQPAYLCTVLASFHSHSLHEGYDLHPINTVSLHTGCTADWLCEHRACRISTACATINNARSCKSTLLCQHSIGLQIAITADEAFRYAHSTSLRCFHTLQAGNRAARNEDQHCLQFTAADSDIICCNLMHQIFHRNFNCQHCSRKLHDHRH